MKTISSFHSILSAIAALGLFSHSAFADTETVSTTFSDAHSFSSTLSLGGFNPSLGTLTAVTLTLNLTTSSTPVVFHLTTSAANYSATYSGFTTTLTGPDLSFITTTTPAYLLSGSLPTATAFTATTLAASVNTTDLSLNIVPANIAQYVSTGNLSLNLSVPNFSSGGSSDPSNALAFGGDGSVSGTAGIIYTYTAAPEPSTWALVFIGTLGLGFFAARRRVQEISI